MYLVDTAAVHVISRLYDAHIDRSAVGSEFIGVAHKIEQNAVEAYPVAQNYAVGNAFVANHIERDILLLHLHREQVVHLVQDTRNVGVLDLELHFTAFYAAHFKNIVYQREKVLAR